ncbi:uncharacterized protein LOC110654170 [Hevea brasiliensis]|nr:uncharacterized protein LOC110654170 [Hevea brasiliensis]
MTYLSQNSSLSENEKLVSTVYNAPKPLAQVSNAGPQYAESLMKFVKDLGPTAQSVANKKLGKCPIEAPNILSWTPTPPPGFGKTADSLLPAPSALQNPAYLNGGNGGQMPCNIISNPPGSYKGKMVCTDGGMNNFGRELIPPHNSLAGARPQTADGGMNSFGRGLIPPHNSLAGARPQTTGGGMNSFGIGLIPPHNSLTGARPQTTDGGLNSFGRGLIPFHNSLAGARPQTTDRGMNSFGRGLIPPYNSLAGAKPQTTDGGLIDYNLLGKQGPNKSTNRDASGSSKSSDNMDLFIATLMQISAIQNRTNHTPSGTYFPLTGYEDFPSAPLSQINKESQSWLLNNRSQPTSLPYQTSQLSSTSKATSSTSSLSGFPNGEGSSNAAPAATAFNQNMPMEWKQSAATQNVLLQQQAQVLPTQEKPMFNAMNFVGGAKPQGHQAESSSQGFWKAIQSSLMDNKKQPDLDLQL